LDISCQTQNSLSSNLTVESVRSDALLQLGRKIVDELGLDQSVDTLGRWMAHYIAELMQSAEAALGDDRAEKQSRCANAILDLWKHRSRLPSGKRPFEDFEPILWALESLALSDNTPRYFRAVRTAAGTDEQHAETQQWLALVEGIDATARMLIRYCLACAAAHALDKAKEWVQLAEALDAEEDVELRIVHLMMKEHELWNASALDASARTQVGDCIRRLDNFVQMAHLLSSDLREKLERLDSTDTTS
jgi:hypothetical protein